MSVGAEIVVVDPHHPDPAVLARAGALLRAGQLVAFPTETVYGLGANALDAAAVTRIFGVKERPADDPLIVHVADLAGVLALVTHLPPLAQALAARFWPGPLTLVLPRGPAVPLQVTAGLDTVAVRMPAHPVALGLIRAAGVPIAAPSANLFTRPSPTRAADVAADLGSRILLILDGGPTTHGVESTVLDLSTHPPRLLRPGALTLEQLRSVLPDLAAPAALGAAARRSPGTMLKHYAPRAEMRLLDGAHPARVLAALAEEVQAAQVAGRVVGLLLTDEDLAALGARAPGPGVRVAALGPAADLAGQAHRLFAALRDLDQAGADLILARAPPAAGLGLTLRDRLRRAAAGRVRLVE
ncbi:MAG TPA: L-threonylcarbamoyladenylate synthase [Chloroflexia bacterium]|nr:L-threonylcarbamoyladenylate synthase [Chloroflexia bacterium]